MDGDLLLESADRWNRQVTKKTVRGPALLRGLLLWVPSFYWERAASAITAKKECPTQSHEKCPRTGCDRDRRRRCWSGRGGDVCKAKVSWVGDNGLEEAE